MNGKACYCKEIASAYCLAFQLNIYRSASYHDAQLHQDVLGDQKKAPVVRRAILAVHSMYMSGPGSKCDLVSSQIHYTHQFRLRWHFKTQAHSSTWLSVSPFQARRCISGTEILHAPIHNPPKRYYIRIVDGLLNVCSHFQVVDMALQVQSQLGHLRMKKLSPVLRILQISQKESCDSHVVQAI